MMIAIIEAQKRKFGTHPTDTISHYKNGTRRQRQIYASAARMGEIDGWLRRHGYEPDGVS